MSIRTRIAPSPTGDPHVGTAYTALFNYVFAKSQGGEFLLRIENTDAARSTVESERAIFDALRWLGLSWDEGPDIGGDKGPYRQSERLPIYRQHVQKLIDQGHAFRCFCTTQRLDEVRASQRAAGETTRYDGRCLPLSVDVAQGRIDAGEAHVVRMKVPANGECTFADRLRGEVIIPYEQIDMQVLLKADGYPTYHLAVVVDDHLMDITHVMRGEEWISSVPKHKLLYEYFGWPMPELIHLPLLRNPDKSKLSKRKNPTSVTYYRDLGVLPEALSNFLGTMGFSMPDEQELFDLAQMQAAFDVDRISLGGPVFDVDKLKWLNGQYIRRLSPEVFMNRVADWALNRERLASLVPLVQERTETFSDLARQVDYLLGDRQTLTAADLQHKTLNQDEVRQVLDHCLRRFDGLRVWQRQPLVESCEQLAQALEVKLRDLLNPLFIAISGREVSLPLFDAMVFLGPDITRVRLRDALDVLGVSKKQTKKLERAYAALKID